jgi:4-amino-4-deoxy-L-arabinose transferase-like glycosyltransferase
MLMLKLGEIKTRLRFSHGLLSYGVLALSIFIFLCWRLASLPGGLSKNEVLSRDNSMDIHGLLIDPVDAPYHLLQNLFLTLHSGILSLRLTSVLVASILVLAFYFYTRNLFGKMTGLLGSLALLSLPFFSISARQATPQIMLFLPLLIIYVFHVFIKSERKTVAWLILAFLSGISLYTPGLLWWLLASAIFSRKKLTASIPKLSRTASGLGIGLLCLCVTPLIVIVILHTQSLKELLLIPSSWPSPLHYGSETLHMFSSLLVKSPGHSSLIIDDLPILNITLIALAAFGGYALFTAVRNKAISLGLSVILAILLAALQEDIAYLGLAVPALAIAVSAGLRYLYVEWRGIFPRYPVPKTFAMVLIAAVTLSQLYYGVNYCLHAWPNSTSVRNVYVLK